jgi:peptidoglycan glycosyltransferase
MLALVSSPTFDANLISGDPATAQGPMDALRSDPDEPLLPRDRQGTYVPGSIMKVFTGAAALDAGVITPETTFPDQPAQEVDGMLVDGFLITEHDLAGIEPDLWSLSEALQVSSNIFFAHVGLELGAQQFLDYARRFGFCEPGGIGPSDRQLNVAPSYVTSPANGDCGPFSGDAELASASFGQGSTVVTPVQMALVAAAIAGGGVMPEPYVVADVRPHTEDGARSDTVQETFTSGGGRRVIDAEAARQMRAAMVDGVNGELGRLFAGQADVTLYGISNARTAGKTGTAQLGGEQAPHSWFIGFAPGEDGATPAIAIAVIVESGGSGGITAAPIAGQVLAEWLRISGADS